MAFVVLDCHVDEAMEMDLDEVLKRVGRHYWTERRNVEKWGTLLGGKPRPEKPSDEEIQRQLDLLKGK